MTAARSFMDRLVAGEAVDIDDFIDEWHDGPETGLKLHEHLGMTWDEYVRYAADSSSLPAMAEERRRAS